MAGTLRAERLEILLPGGKGIWIPIDHGVSSWPVAGLQNIANLLEIIQNAGADAVIAHKGVVSSYCSKQQVPMMMHLSASTIHAGQHRDNKLLVGSAQEALSRGALGVSVQVNLGDAEEASMLERLGRVSEDCHRLELPLLGMIYPRGPGLMIGGDETKGCAHAVRVAWELGCDAVKTSWPGTEQAFAEVVAAAPIPVLIAGGESVEDFTPVLRMVEAAMQAGGAGVCMGRQVFGNSKPGAFIKALRALIHEGATFEAACEVL